MDPTQRTQTIRLAVLCVILAGVVWFVLLPALAPGGVAPRGPLPAAGTASAAKASGAPPQVKLDALGRDTAEPAAGEGGRRNPFRMGAAPAPIPEGTSARVATKPPPPVMPEQIGPPPVPPPPPIPYRFIGILSGAPGQGRIAVLTDGRTVVHGGVNQSIEGRYRIVQIGEESLQIEYADGRGRQTLRLLGQ